MIRQAFFAILLTASPVLALNLIVPGGTETRRDVSPAATVALPRAAWSADATPPGVDGALLRRAFRIGGGSQTTLQILTPLRDSLQEAGYQVVFGCESRACGGFDFRFQLDLLGEPDMHVDLGDFRYLLAEHPNPKPDAAHTISLVVSRDAQAGFVHITEVFAISADIDAQISISTTGTSFAPGDLTAKLETTGHAVLSDLNFGSGEIALGGSNYESLSSLAMWLLSKPDVTVAIVGHTDAVGGLAGNTALSRQRAQSVLARLRDVHGVPSAQMEADGVGYLAPIASNLTEDGRASNRRVEVILLSDDG